MYASVKGIVNKARKEFYIKLWDRDDWEQEGMMTLFELLEDQPWLVDEQVQLYCYFKVKFRNRIKDRIRKQESQNASLTVCHMKIFTNYLTQYNHRD